MASLLDRALDDSRTQDSHRGRGRGARGRSVSGRSSPYSKPAPRVDPDASSWQHDLFQTQKLDYGGEGSSNDAVKSPRDDDGARSTRLKITNLHYEVSERELEVLFQQIGPLAPGQGKETNPAIKFDASGRSLGEATVTYESEADAVAAKKAFHHALAKGERIIVEYDFSAPRRAPRKENGLQWNSIPSGGLNSMKGGSSANSLLARLDKSHELRQPPQYASSIGRAAGQSEHRGSRGGGTPFRGNDSGRGRGAPRGRGRGAGRGPRNDRAQKTQEDLDKELDDFMAKGNDAAPAPPQAEDVEMS